MSTISGNESFPSPGAPGTLRRTRTMLFRMLKRKQSETGARFTAETHCTFDSPPKEFADTPSSVETHTDSNSNGNDSLAHSFETASQSTQVPEFVYQFSSEEPEPAIPAMPAPPQIPEFVSAAPAIDYESPKRHLNIPIIPQLDPNMPVDDDRLEPIQAVVTEYSRTLNDAFFGDEEEAVIDPEEKFEQAMSRRSKLRNALRSLKKGRDRS